MKVGSLVLCLHTFQCRHGEEGIKRPVANEIYTIRGFTKDDRHTGLLLKEIVNPIMNYCDGPAEISFYAKHFRELQPPQSITLSDLLPEPKEHAATALEPA